MRGRLACPGCGTSRLTSREAELRCEDCSALYPMDRGIPVMVPHMAGRPAVSLQKAGQAAFTDEEIDVQYETVRPHCTPLIHAELLISKMRRGIRGLESIIRGGTALVVCGGSGMDAEFLARAGARVVSTDISSGGAARVRERASRYGLDVTAAVADAEHLPFQNRSFDLVWVHDGLHHLEDPAAALLEMARVARHAVSVNEPARAAVTALATRLGLAQAREESGNEVARLRREDVARVLESRGFMVLTTERYAMVYRHKAGPVYRLLSRQSLARTGLTATRAAETLLGPIGNKLSVRAIRATS